MSPRFVAILGLIALLSTSACAASPQAPPAGDRGVATDAASRREAVPASVSAAAPAPKQAAIGGAGTGATADQLQQNLPSADTRMIIRTVSMTIAVADVSDVFRKVEQLAKDQRGFISTSQIRQDGDRLTATMTLRVPADPATYQTTLDRLRAVADRVVDEQSQAQDVTEQYVDLDARMRTLKASEETMLALLNRAQKIEDILQIQRELTNVRSQIEQIQGRKQVLERQSDLATINLTIREAGAFSRPGWSPGGTAEEAIRALGMALRSLATIVIWLAIFSPIWGGFLLIVYGIVRLIIRLARRGSRRPPLTPTAPPPAVAAPSA